MTPPAPVPSVKFRSQKTRALLGPLLRWFGRHARPLPWRLTRDAYGIWVSEIMLQQTQVKTVIPYWERWMRELPNVRALAVASPAYVLKLWEGLGYYSRVRNLQRSAQLIQERHDGAFPRCFDAILELPGIGRYTAGAISSMAFHEPRPILDGNIIRILTRLFGIAGETRERKTNDRLWHLAGQLVGHAGPARCSALNQSLMELGALVCTPRSPRCEVCPLRVHCVAFRSNRIDELPNLAPRPTAIQRRIAAFVIERNGAFLVRQRPADAVNAHLWEFPNIDITDSPAANARELLRQHFRIRPKLISSLGTIRHSITRYRIVLEAFHVVHNRAPQRKGETWLPFPQLDALPFASAHRKIVASLEQIAR
ncbi:MAG: A/G-specific adenine glycosylase [Verrucomicrobiota bacterium]|jgi:A/G-specific adenine glycosylase